MNPKQSRALFYATILGNPWIPHKPHIVNGRSPQTDFLVVEVDEALYGGSAGSGKSDALLMSALQFVDVPGYSALLIRRTYKDLALPGALMDRAIEWLIGMPGIHWSAQEKRFTFPSGATISFGYLSHPNDKYQYQGAEFQFIGFDELTQFPEADYTYLFSRLRRKKGIHVPIRMRSASNPGGIGHEWVKRRFIDSHHPDRLFIPAKLQDNPSLNYNEYVKSLNHLDPITRLRLLDGDWTARSGGSKFKREWFQYVDVAPEIGMLEKVRYWDFAATPKDEGNPASDPDYAVGCLVGKHRNGSYYVLDVVRDRITPNRLEELVRRTANRDGKLVKIWIEQEPGSSGKIVIDHYIKNILPGYVVHGERVTGSKESYADPTSSQVEAGNVVLINAPWVEEFLNELEAFPTDGIHDDQVDSFSKGMDKLFTKRGFKVY